MRGLHAWRVRVCKIRGMYRVFESLDELVQHLEGAHGFPMTSNCVVPRHEMLALLDDLRNALPVEIDDAQDVFCLLYTSPSPRD